MNERIPKRRSLRAILGRIVRSRFWFFYVLVTTIVGTGWDFIDDRYYKRSIAVIEIENRADSPIVAADIGVCAHQLRLGGLAPGGTARMRYRIECETGYDARFRLASGADVEVLDVYATKGLGSIDRFVVEAEHARLETHRLSDAERDAANRR